MVSVVCLGIIFTFMSVKLLEIINKNVSIIGLGITGLRCAPGGSGLCVWGQRLRVRA